MDEYHINYELIIMSFGCEQDYWTSSGTQHQDQKVTFRATVLTIKPIGPPILFTNLGVFEKCLLADPKCDIT